MRSVDVYHNIVWSRYKAGVFSELYSIAGDFDIKVNIIQIAETEKYRISLSGVDLSYHKYPYTLLFKGAYDEIPWYKKSAKLFYMVCKSRSDFILLHGFHYAEHWAMLIGCLVTGKKFGIFCDSTLNDRRQSKFKGVLKKIFFSLCDGFFVYGVKSKEYVVNYGANEGKVFYRCQAAALPKLYSLDKVVGARKARIKNSGYNESYIIGYVGRLSVEKNIDDLIYAFEKLNKIHNNVLLQIVGAGLDEGRLRGICKNISCESKILFLGGKSQDELDKIYLNMDCMVLPSRSEPWGLVVNEALSYGCPVIVSDACGCIPELVKNGVTGYSYAVGDIDDLFEKLKLSIEFLANIPDTYKNCLEIIEPYSPINAAKQICVGVNSVL